MSDRYSVEELNEIIENEGLSGAILDYLDDPDNIEDDTVRRLWNDAKAALEDLDEVLGGNLN